MNYLIDTCDGDKGVCIEYINCLKQSISERNKTQGENGVFTGYARRDYVTLRNILKENILPEDSVLNELMCLAVETLEESNEGMLTKTDAAEFIIFLLGIKPNYVEIYKDKINCLYSKRKNLVVDRPFELSNVNPIALELAVVLLKDMISQDDMYYEIMELISLVKDDTATLITMTAILRRFYEQSNFSLSKRIETALLSNILFWINSDVLEIKWNSCKIFFALMQRFTDSNLLERKLYEMMNKESVYIKTLILNNLKELPIEEKTKSELLEKAKSDNNYIVRLEAKDILVE